MSYSSPDLLRNTKNAIRGASVVSSLSLTLQCRPSVTLFHFRSCGLCEVHPLGLWLHPFFPLSRGTLTAAAPQYFPWALVGCRKSLEWVWAARCSIPTRRSPSRIGLISRVTSCALALGLWCFFYSGGSTGVSVRISGWFFFICIFVPDTGAWGDVLIQSIKCAMEWKWLLSFLIP